MKNQEEEQAVKSCTCACDCDCDCETPETLGPDMGEEMIDDTDLDAANAATDELLKWRDVAMRTAAEYDNYRKRCVKERDEFTRYATRGLLEELLPVIDNFEMGMQMATQDTQSMIYIGMNMVQKQLNDFLEAQGVKRIETQVGDIFDHNVHEAIQNEVNADMPEGSIIRVIRPGYMHKERLLRAANVVTAIPAAPQETAQA